MNDDVTYQRRRVTSKLLRRAREAVLGCGLKLCMKEVEREAALAKFNF
jgi:hypothetical protein